MRGPRLHWPPPGVRVLTSVTLDLASSSLSSPPPNTGTLSFSTSPSSGIAPSGVPELAQLLRDLHPQLPCSEELWYTMPYVIPSRRRGFHLGRTPPPRLRGASTHYNGGGATFSYHPSSEEPHGGHALHFHSPPCSEERLRGTAPELLPAQSGGV